MPIETVFDLLKKILENLYPNKKFQIDKTKFKEDLTTKYNQSLHNITLPMSIIEKILLEPVSLKAYAQAHNVSYSSIQKNTNMYCSLSKQGSNLYIARYELFHSSRLQDHYGKQSEYYISKNEALVDILLEEAARQNKSVASIVYEIVRNYYKV